MKKYYGSQRITSGIFALACGILFMLAGCKNETGTSLFDTVVAGKPQPTITSITQSPTPALAGVSVFTIKGTNFSTNNAENRLFFDGTLVTPSTSSATQMTVKAPILIKDSILLKVNVIGADKYSNAVPVNIKAAVTSFPATTFAASEEAYGLACDAAGNLYASMLKSSAGEGINKFVRPDSVTNYCLANGVTFWAGLKIGPGGDLYGVRNVRALYKIPAGAASATPFVAIAGASLSDLDFDKYGDIWTVGANANIYRVLSPSWYVAYPFTGTLRTVRVYNDYLYVGGKVDSTEAVYRFKIQADTSLGVPEKYFDLSNCGLTGYGYNGPGVDAITFNTDGEMYLGTDGPDAILLVHAGGGSVEPFYPGLFTPQTYAFAWGTGSTLYASRQTNLITVTKTIITINTLKTSAPYYGRGDH